MHGTALRSLYGPRISLLAVGAFGSMLSVCQAAGRARAEAAGISNISFHACDVQDHEAVRRHSLDLSLSPPS